MKFDIPVNVDTPDTFSVPCEVIDDVAMILPAISVPCAVVLASEVDDVEVRVPNIPVPAVILTGVDDSNPSDEVLVSVYPPRALPSNTCPYVGAVLTPVPP